MKKRNTAKQQKGFFDLGLSLAILALSGATIHAVSPDQDARVTAQEPETEVVANMELGNENRGLYQ